MLTLKDVELLLAPAAKPTTATAKWFDGEQWHSGKPPAVSVGSFQGRAGSIRRSSKGRTYRLSNGKRSYVMNPDSNVVAYKV